MNAEAEWRDRESGLASRHPSDYRGCLFPWTWKGFAMKLINTDGMAFIGPGSEWFWTALTGLVLAVTFLAIYRQLSITRNANAVEQLNAFEREVSSERMIRHKLEVLVALRDGVDPAHVPDFAANAIAGFWDVVGGLARRGHLDPTLLRAGSAGDCTTWWVELAPFVRKRRTGWDSPTAFANFEWLAGVLAGFDRRAGMASLDEAWHGQYELRIGWLHDMLRIEQALRTVIVASPDALTVGQPPAPAAGTKPRRRSPATP